MTVETATYIADLQPLNPPSTDPRGQGDDHLRLIKQVLQNSLANVTRAFYIQKAGVSKSVDYSIVVGDGGQVFYTNTGSGAVTYTLPSGLASLDAGWEVSFIKTTSDANPIFIAPATGTLNSGGIATLAKARRAVMGIRFRAFWDGTGWFVERALTAPIGSTVPFYGSSLPAGYEWPSGQTLSSASTNYPEYNSVRGSGTTPDLRGRVEVGLDNLGGSSAGRLSGGIITGTTLEATGGSDVRSLSTTNLPAYTPAGSVSSTSATSVLQSDGPTIATPASGIAPSLPRPWISTNVAISSSFSGSAQGGSSAAFGILQPSIMCAKLLVVE